MFHGRRRLASWLMVPTALLLSAFIFFGDSKESSGDDEWLKKNLEARQVISQALGTSVKANKRPTNGLFVSPVNAEKTSYKINYTFDEDLQKEADLLLKRYRPDYAAIVMMDAKTGRILALSSFEKKNILGENLALKATFPAASIFKVITASAAVDKAGVTPEHRIAFNGGNYTLYKKNVLSDKVNRWTRFITLKEAFARSINTAFGRLSLETLQPRDLSDYAQRFMFNEEIPADFAVEKSVAKVPTEKGFELTEVASGFNRFNTLSPVHGAMISATMINDGKMMVPYIVDSLENAQGEKVYTAQPLERGQILSPESATQVREMMEQTVLSGTSRKSFRKLIRDKKFKEVEMGGKTGHFSGLNPKGRNDWFVGYASDGDDRIAIAAITVNVQKWTVKSSALGEMMFRRHFKDKINERDAVVEAKPRPTKKVKVAKSERTPAQTKKKNSRKKRQVTMNREENKSRN